MLGMQSVHGFPRAKALAPRIQMEMITRVAVDFVEGPASRSRRKVVPDRKPQAM